MAFILSKLEKHARSVVQSLPDDDTTNPDQSKSKIQSTNRTSEARYSSQTWALNGIYLCRSKKRVQPNTGECTCDVKVCSVSQSIIHHKGGWGENGVGRDGFGEMEMHRASFGIHLPRASMKQVTSRIQNMNQCVMYSCTTVLLYYDFTVLISI